MGSTQIPIAQLRSCALGTVDQHPQPNPQAPRWNRHRPPQHPLPRAQLRLRNGAPAPAAKTLRVLWSLYELPQNQVSKENLRGLDEIQSSSVLAILLI